MSDMLAGGEEVVANRGGKNSNRKYSINSGPEPQLAK